MKTVKRKTDTGIHILLKAEDPSWTLAGDWPLIAVTHPEGDLSDPSFSLEFLDGSWNRAELVAIKAIIDGALAFTKRKPKSHKPRRRSRT
jgi:hypothetical protein